MDWGLFQWVNGLAGHWIPVDVFMIFLSRYVIYGLIGMLLIMLLTVKRLYAFAGIGGIVSGMGINYVISIIYARPRPFVAFDVNLLIDKAASASFPSDQAVIAFAAATAILLVSRRMGWWFIILGCLVAVSRIYVGHHYPTDVIVGGLIGGLLTYVCYVTLLKINWPHTKTERKEKDLISKQG